MQRRREMKMLRKMGGFAAFYMATAYLVGIILFLVVLDYPSITDPAQKVALIVEKTMVFFTTNLILYVLFGIFLVVFALALYELLKEGASALLLVGVVIGIIWAGSLVASGMISNAGLDPVVMLYAQDPEQAALTWQGIEAVASGVGNGNGEILGGVMTLLISWAALQAGEFPKALNYLGAFVGVVGIVSILPPLVDVVGLFGIGQMIWFVWLGIILVRNDK
jgi:hypothetical protein